MRGGSSVANSLHYAVDVGSESLSATLCLTKAFSEYLVETLAFVDALGHNMVLLRW